MKTLVAPLLLALVVGSFPGVLASEDLDRQDAAGDWRVLQHTVQEVLTGSRRLGPNSARIAPGARLAVGGSVLDLATAVAAGHADLLAQDQTTPPTLIRQKMDPDGSAAFMLLGMERDSKMCYHTVVFMKDSTGTWMVETWHVSS